MSKQELYAWTSFLSTVALLGYYVLVIVEPSGGVAGYAGEMKALFLKVIGIALLVEIVLELSRYVGARGVEKDERDHTIAAKGFRNAYFFVMVALVSLLGNLWVSDVLSRAAGERVFLAIPFATVHALLAIVLLAQIIRSATQLYYYRRGG